LDEHEHPIEQIAELIGELGVAGAGEGREREVAVAPQREAAEQVVAETVAADAVDELERIDAVAEALADLATIDGEEAMHDDVRACEERGPVDAVKAREVLADDMDAPLALGPEALEARARARGVRIDTRIEIVERADVVRERVEPDIDRL